jgi:hypothetical protein
MATSSPSLISRSHCGESSPSISTYSKLTVKAQLLRTFAEMPAYRASSSANRSRALTGAGRSSVDLAVKLAAAAKYKMEKWPFAGAMLPMLCGMLALGQLLRKKTNAKKILIREKGSAGQRRSAARIIHAIVFDIHHKEGSWREIGRRSRTWSAEVDGSKKVGARACKVVEDFCQVPTCRSDPFRFRGASTFFTVMASGRACRVDSSHSNTTPCIHRYDHGLHCVSAGSVNGA